MQPISNCLSIDVEDYFQVNAFAPYVHRDQWQSFPLRVERNTGRILDILDSYGIKATFFILGWVAEKIPSLAPEIHRRGHEIACHGYGHELIYQIGPDKFRDDIRRAKNLLEGQIGDRVSGYRAPSYSITRRSMWALSILVQEGFTYDSSIFPIYHDTYGIPDAQRFPHSIETEAGSLLEFPLTTVALNLGLKKIHLPIAGGGYLRLLPAGMIRSGIASINMAERQPAVVYFHPWEIDPDQPRIQAGFKSRFRHYLNLRGTEKKLMFLFGKLSFAPMKTVFSQLGVACA